ncbi:MAG: hypothetical protein E7F76_05400 [Actinomyces sp.]|nr:hypothetical protein [Actinomyces sp.]
MDQLRRFSGAAAACAVAVIAAIVAVLALTVWKPTQQISATVTPQQPVVITREGLFQLEGGEVTVTAASASGKQVTMALGTAADVRAWVSDLSYAEITVISANRENLLTEGHDSATSATSSPSPSPSPSSEAPQNPDQNAQPSPSPSAIPTLSAAGGDMWLDEATAPSTATMTLRDVAAGRSLVITSDGTTPSDLTVTMTWQTPHANVLAITAGVITFICLLIAAALVGLVLWRERQVDSEEEKRKEDEAEDGASQQVDPAFFEAADNSESSEAESETLQGDNEGAEEYSDSAEGGETSDEVTAQDAFTEVAEFDEETPEDESSEDRAVEERVEVNETSVTDRDKSSDSEPRRGRHGIAYHDDEVDPPVRESTDTGIIDLSGIRPGAVLPSRRALRQAREKGEGRLVIGGQEFDTGLIPQVEKEEEVSTGDGSEEKRSWGSIMGSWISPKQRGQKGQ